MKKALVVVLILGVGFLAFKIVGAAVTAFAMVPRRYTKWVLPIPLVILAIFAATDYAEYAEAKRIVQYSDDRGVVQDPLQLAHLDNETFVIFAKFDPSEPEFVMHERLAGDYRAIYRTLDECELKQIAWVHGFSSIAQTIDSRGISQSCGLVAVEIEV